MSDEHIRARMGEGVTQLSRIADITDGIAGTPDLTAEQYRGALGKAAEAMRATSSYMQEVQPALIEHGRIHGLEAAIDWLGDINADLAIMMASALLPGEGQVR